MGVCLCVYVGGGICVNVPVHAKPVRKCLSVYVSVCEYVSVCLHVSMCAWGGGAESM